MVQAIENRSVARCRRVGEPGPGPNETWVEVRVSVEEAEPVDGYPHLLAEGLPRELTALVRTEVYAADLGPKGVARLEVEVVGPNRLRVRRAV